MKTLNKLIQSAYRTTKECAGKRQIKNLRLHTHNLILPNNDNKKLEIIAGFDRISQNLQELKVELTDFDTEKQFSKEELQSLTGFIGNPDHLKQTGFNSLDYLLDPTFKLNIVKNYIIKKTKFESKYDKDNVVNYDEFGEIWGINLRSRNQKLTLQAFKNIDISKVPEAYQWAATKEFSQSLFLSKKNKINYLKILCINNNLNPNKALVRNRFRLEHNINNLYRRSMEIAPEQVDEIESKINSYRKTDLSQAQFYVMGGEAFIDKSDRFNSQIARKNKQNSETLFKNIPAEGLLVKGYR